MIPEVDSDEGATFASFEGMDRLDDALRAVSAMVNSFGRATVLIGADGDGRAVGTLAEADAERVRSRMAEGMNHLPRTEVSVVRSEGGSFVRVDASGEEIPYSWGGWFYCRRRVAEQKSDGTTSVSWRDSLTCGMRHHRSTGTPTAPRCVSHLSSAGRTVSPRVQVGRQEIDDPVALGNLRRCSFMDPVLKHIYRSVP